MKNYDLHLQGWASAAAFNKNQPLRK